MGFANGWAVHLLGAAALLTASGCTSESSSLGSNDLVGTWNGYIELLQFTSGSDQVKFTITAVEGSTVTGTVLFGNGTLLPPATNPDVEYPNGSTQLFDSDMANEVEGFEYTMVDTDATSTRLQLSLNLFQLWGGWCALQTPSANSHAASGWWCGGGADVSNQTQAQAVCPVVCDCTASACAARPLDVAPISFDLVVGDDQIQGSVVGLWGSEGEVRDVVLTQE